MNTWSDRHPRDLGAGGAVLGQDEAPVVWRLAPEPAPLTGTRQCAPLATCLNGRAAAGQSREGPIRLLEVTVKVATTAGPAGGALGLDLRP